MKVDCNGETVSVRRPIEAEKVFPSWPKPGRAAVQPINKMMTGELTYAIEHPYFCLGDEAEWPERPPPQIEGACAPR